jgi:hypothetical protein
MRFMKLSSIRVALRMATKRSTKMKIITPARATSTHISQPPSMNSSQNPIETLLAVSTAV